MKKFLAERWFFIMLALALFLGLALAKPLAPLAQQKTLRNVLVAAVLFLMALPLPALVMWDSLRRPWAALLAVLINYGLLPLFAWGLSWMLYQCGLSEEMMKGLMLAAATPSTMASASVWTRRAEGNDGVSVLVTLITNGMCFLLTPLWLWWTTGESAEISLAEMMLTLAYVVVLPMVAAQLLRVVRPVARWATVNKLTLGTVSQCGILSMVFLGAIQTGSSLQQASTGGFALELGVIIAAVVTIHLAMLWVGLAMSRRLGLSRADGIAVAFSGSQKTLTVGLQSGMQLGISVLPMVAYHISQLLVDAVIADQFRKQKRLAVASGN